MRNAHARQAGVTLSAGLVAHWERCALIAKKAGRPIPPDLPPESRRFLEDLSAWRNYLLHGDDRSSARLAERGLDRDDFGASLARKTLRDADTVLEYGSSATGGQLLQSEQLWPGLERTAAPRPHPTQSE